jgi:hypothetical protein
VRHRVLEDKSTNALGIHKTGLAQTTTLNCEDWHGELHRMLECDDGNRKKDGDTGESQQALFC